MKHLPASHPVPLPFLMCLLDYSKITQANMYMFLCLFIIDFIKLCSFYILFFSLWFMWDLAQDNIDESVEDRMPPMSTS